MSPDTVLQAVKQAIRTNTRLFDSLYPPTTVYELVQRGNQFAMLKDDVIVAIKRTVANTSDIGCDNGSKGKKSRDDQDRIGKCDSRESRRSGHHSVVEGSRD